MSDQLDLAALRALCNERVALAKEVDAASVRHDHQAAIDARGRKAIVEREMLYVFPAILAAASERAEVATWTERCAEARSVARQWEEKCAALQCEVDACGAIIGQPPGATHGHAEIIAATIEEHRAAAGRLSAEVEALKVEVERVRSVAERWEYVAWGARDILEEGAKPKDVLAALRVEADAARTAALAPRAAAKEARDAR
jgi:hypothetical protein